MCVCMDIRVVARIDGGWMMARGFWEVPVQGGFRLFYRNDGFTIV